MNVNAVFYKGSYLFPNSQCFGLFTAKKFRELDILLKALDAKELQLLERYK